VFQACANFRHARSVPTGASHETPALFHDLLCVLSIFIISLFLVEPNGPSAPRDLRSLPTRAGFDWFTAVAGWPTRWTQLSAERHLAFAGETSDCDYFFFDPHSRTFVIEELDAHRFQHRLNLGQRFREPQGLSIKY
jgi:hypothetical protein